MAITAGASVPFSRVVSYAGLLQGLSELTLNESRQRVQSQRVLPREEYIFNPTPISANDIESPGEKRLAQFENLVLNGMGMRLGQFQRDLALACTEALCENIVGQSEWRKVGERIRRARNWNDTRKNVLASAPRRLGKSSCICKIAAAYAICVPGSVQCIFSTGRRASKSDLQYVYKFVCDAGCRSWVVTFNQEELELNPNPKDPNQKSRKIFSYPSKARIRSIILLLFVVCVARSRPRPRRPSVLICTVATLRWRSIDRS